MVPGRGRQGRRSAAGSSKFGVTRGDRIQKLLAGQAWPSAASVRDQSLNGGFPEGTVSGLARIAFPAEDTRVLAWVAAPAALGCLQSGRPLQGKPTWAGEVRGRCPDPYTQLDSPLAQDRRPTQRMRGGQGGAVSIRAWAGGGKDDRCPSSLAPVGRRSPGQRGRVGRPERGMNPKVRTGGRRRGGRAPFRKSPDRRPARPARSSATAADRATWPGVPGDRRVGARDARPTGRSSGGPPRGWAAGAATAAFAR